MKIDLSIIDRTEFNVKEGLFCNVPAVLVTPKNLGVKWTKDNIIFRSSIWNLDGELLSGSFCKFGFIGENPETFPPPISLDNSLMVNKIDGSTFLTDYVNGKTNIRTRGSFDFSNQTNAKDFSECLNKYPKIEEWIRKNHYYTLICEITTPNNKIILNYGNEVKLWLIGVVRKSDYSYWSQEMLDELSEEIGVPRPEYFHFKNLDDLILHVKESKSIEGVVLYVDSQRLFKIKGDDYLLRHKFKENLSVETIIDLYLASGEPTYNQFLELIATQFDHECMQDAVKFVSKTCDAAEEMAKIINHFNIFVNQVKNLTRKEAAAKIISSYGTTNRAAFLFKLLDGKGLTKDDKKKLLFQVLKH